MSLLRNLALAGLAGILMALAFPDANIWPLAIASAACAVVCPRTLRGVVGLLIGWAFGIAFLLPHVYLGVHLRWLHPVDRAVSSRRASVSGSLAPHGPSVRRSAMLMNARAWVQPLTFALLWGATEELRSMVPFGGFPWGRVAFSQSGSPYREPRVGGRRAARFDGSGADGRGDRARHRGRQGPTLGIRCRVPCRCDRAGFLRRVHSAQCAAGDRQAQRWRGAGQRAERGTRLVPTSARSHGESPRRDPESDCRESWALRHPDLARELGGLRPSRRRADGKDGDRPPPHLRRRRSCSAPKTSRPWTAATTCRCCGAPTERCSASTASSARLRSPSTSRFAVLPGTSRPPLTASPRTCSPAAARGDGSACPGTWALGHNLHHHLL